MLTTKEQLAIHNTKLDNITNLLQDHLVESKIVRTETTENKTKVNFLMKGFWVVAVAVIGLLAWVVRIAFTQ